MAPIDPAQELTPEEVEVLFRSWWSASYPGAPPGTHAVNTHVAFGIWLRQQPGHGD